MQDETLALLSQSDARNITDRIKSRSEELWDLLLEAYEREAHTALGYSSWGAYFEEEFGGGKSRAYQLIDAGRVVRAIEGHSTVVELPNERQARALAPVAKANPEEAVQIWKEESERAAGKGVELTSTDLQQAARAATKRKEKEQRRLIRLDERAESAEKMESHTLDERVQIVHADFRDALGDIPDGSVDLILTDPPYPAEYLPQLSDLGYLASQCLKDGGVLAMMYGNRYLPEVYARLSEHLTYHWTMAYLTPGGQSYYDWQRNVNTFWKPVLLYVKGDYVGDCIGDVAKSADNDKRFHHWGQSESGTSDLMERLSKPGDTVIDPFVGGGTTAVVAALTHRKFLGCDLSRQAIETTRYRLSELVEPGSDAE